MIGFKITVNDAEVINVACESVVTLDLETDGETGDSNMVVIGSDSKFDYIYWANKRLKLGDKIKVTVTGIDEVSPPIKKKPKDRSILKKQYDELKKELEDYGLIQKS